MSIINRVVTEEVFKKAEEEKKRREGKMGDDSFEVSIPKLYGYVGIVCALLFIILCIILTFTSEEPIPIYGYAIFIGMVLVGVGLAFAPSKTKLIVEGNNMTKYTFTGSFKCSFSDIVSVKRECKQTNRGQAERVIMKTNEGKKIKADNSYISYDLLVNKIKANVSKDKLKGF